MRWWKGYKSCSFSLVFCQAVSAVAHQMGRSTWPLLSKPGVFHRKMGTLQRSLPEEEPRIVMSFLCFGAVWNKKMGSFCFPVCVCEVHGEVINNGKPVVKRGGKESSNKHQRQFWRGKWKGRKNQQMKRALQRGHCVLPDNPYTSDEIWIEGLQPTPRVRDMTLQGWEKKILWQSFFHVILHHQKMGHLFSKNGAFFPFSDLKREKQSNKAFCESDMRKTVCFGRRLYQMVNRDEFNQFMLNQRWVKQNETQKKKRKEKMVKRGKKRMNQQERGLTEERRSDVLTWTEWGVQSI